MNSTQLTLPQLNLIELNLAQLNSTQLVHVHKIKDTGDIKVEVDVMKQRFDNLSKHSKSQDKFRHVHSSQT